MNKVVNETQNLLRSYQKLLRLQDWVIALRQNCSPDDFQIKDNCGEVEWQEVNKCAVIKLLDPKFYNDRIIPYDIEKTLVHELLHIKFSLLDNSGNELQDRIVHCLVEDLSKSIVEAGRK